jgi:hypothetical protein
VRIGVGRCAAQVRLNHGGPTGPSGCLASLVILPAHHASFGERRLDYSAGRGAKCGGPYGWGSTVADHRGGKRRSAWCSGVGRGAPRHLNPGTHRASLWAVLSRYGWWEGQAGPRAGELPSVAASAPSCDVAVVHDASRKPPTTNASATLHIGECCPQACPVGRRCAAPRSVSPHPDAPRPPPIPTPMLHHAARHRS